MMRDVLFKVEQRRVLVPVGAPCPFGCRYCYTRGGEVGIGHVRETRILASFQAFAAAHNTEFETIQFGYDGDPFAFPERGISMLRELAALGKHVNFSTKATLSAETLASLSELHAQMDAMGTTLSALVSLSCWDSALFVEPHTPSPAERMQSILHLRHISIPVFIALRPILPHIADEEYERIVMEGLHAQCNGFILGPLYADDRGQFVRFIPPEILQTIPHRRKTVPWSAHAPIWTRYEQEARTQQLTAMIQQHGGQVFLSSADTMALFSRELIGA